MGDFTRRDHDFLVGELDRAASDPGCAPHDAVRAAGTWLGGLDGTHGLERVLVRDITSLCAYAREPGRDDIRRLASAALKLMTGHPPTDTASGETSRLPGLALLASIALAEIRNRTQGRVLYDPPPITAEERRQAESLFLAHADAPLFDDAELLRRAKMFSEDILPLAGSPFLGRIIHGVRSLMAAIESSTGPDERTWARAGLSYLLRPDDAIDDRLGLVGLLDDLFVVEMATAMIRPDREPWTTLLNAVVSSWPFLLDTLMGESVEDATPPSELVLVHAALACGELTSSQGSDPEPNVTTIVTPSAGPLPFLLGIVAVLSCIRRQPVPTGERFKPGDLVLVDNKACVIYRGRRLFAPGSVRILLEEKSRSQQVTLQARTLGLHEEYRLSPAPAGRAVSGSVPETLPPEKCAISPLERLFNAYTKGPLPPSDRHVLVVTDSSTSRAWARRTLLHGRPLCQVLPMGHLTRAGQIRSWSSDAFGATPPALLCCSDIDVAAEYVSVRSPGNRADLESTIDRIVVDLTGANRSAHAGLRRLLGTGLSSLVFVDEDDDRALPILDEANGRTWCWSEDDLDQLVWSTADPAGTLPGYERRMRWLSRGSLNLQVIELPAARDAYQALCTLGRSPPEGVGADASSPEPGDLRLLRADGFGLLCELLRRTEPVCQGDDRELLLGRILRLDERARTSRYLTETERKNVTASIDGLVALLGALESENPKATALAALLQSCPGLYVLDNGRVANDAVLNDGAVVAAWWGRDAMKRLLRPPVADPLFAILYGPEEEWRRSFVTRLRRRQAERTARYPREVLFRGVGHAWKSRPGGGKHSDDIVPGRHFDFDQIRKETLEARKGRYLATAGKGRGTPEVETRMVAFEHGAVAFLTTSYDVNVVTHLLKTTDLLDEEEAVKVRGVDQLCAGDYVIFPVDSARDAIRTTADRILATGTRDRAKRWQRALRSWQTRTQMSEQEICAVFQHRGCRRHPATIRRWIDEDDLIAPRFEDDLRMIADVTEEPELTRNIGDCLEAVSQVLSAHFRAARELARKVVAHAVQQLALGPVGPMRLDDVYLVCVEQLDDEMTTVPRTLANRLLGSPEGTGESE